MTFDVLINNIQKLFPVLFVERVFPHWIRARVVSITRTLFLLSVLGGLVIALVAPDQGFDRMIIGIGLLLISIGFYTFLIEAYYFSRVTRFTMVDVGRPTLALSMTLYEAKRRDLTASFLSSRYGTRLLKRIGADRASVATFIQSPRTPIEPTQLLVVGQGMLGLADYAAALFDADKDFAAFMLTFSVDRPTLIDAATWVDGEALLMFRRGRWWSKTFLIKSGGLGESIAYGRARTLDRYAKTIGGGEALLPGVVSAEEMQDVDNVERVLVRAEEPHCIVVSDDRNELLAVLSRMAERINERQTVSTLHHRHIMLMDGNLLLADAHSIEEFQRLLGQVIGEAEMAGNIILVVEGFASLIRYAAAHQGDLGDILGDSLTSGQLPIVALATKTDFHEHIDGARKLTQHFETVKIEPKKGKALLRSLQGQCLRIESTSTVLYSIQALKELEQSLEHYFLGELESDTARDILMSLPAEAIKAGRKIITRDDVSAIVGQKTGVPTGHIDVAEQEKLLHLEDILHKKIIGQDEAIVAIARAMRRARTSLESAARPLGSFLFLGSTGVGKTETAKALASVFFGDASHMLRLDMSEYAGGDGLQKLIGSSTTDSAGTLTSLLRDHQYGVLLLDEFEKAAPNVHNIFLQILDEGFFSDPSGTQINARNTIIIATSNAGGDLIWDMLQKGSTPAEHRDEIIDHLVSSGIFRPELINRFDDVILFHPLAAEHLKRVAEILLAQLSERVASKGFNLTIKPELVDFVVQHGSDPHFGARPMRRAIQDALEEAIARAMIAGTIKAGDSISFKPRADKPDVLDVVVG